MIKELTVEAIDENLEAVQAFVRDELEERGCKLPLIIQLEIAIEEIFINIAHYAYDGVDTDNRYAIIRFDITGEPMELYLEFVDGGVPFNPLEKEDADTTLSAEERGIGGLGILMVKKTMDSMDYHYRDNTNILSMRRVLQ